MPWDRYVFLKIFKILLDKVIEKIKTLKRKVMFAQTMFLNKYCD